MFRKCGVFVISTEVMEASYIRTELFQRLEELTRGAVDLEFVWEESLLLI